MIQFKCPTCRTNLSMPDASAGKDTPCVICGKSVRVPWPEGREPPPLEEARPAARQRRSRRDEEDDRRDDDYEDDYRRRRRRREEYDDYDDRRRGFRCPYCRSDRQPRIRNEMSETGMILLICLLVAFFPLFWIGFLIREDMRYCSDCGAKLGKCV